MRKTYSVSSPLRLILVTIPHKSWGSQSWLPPAFQRASRRLSAGVSRCEELAPGPKAPGTLENKGQPSAQAARGFHQHHLLAAHHAKRKIALRQHVAKVGRGFHAPRKARQRLADENVETGRGLVGLGAVDIARHGPAMVRGPLVTDHDAGADVRRRGSDARGSQLAVAGVDHGPQFIGVSY